MTVLITGGAGYVGSHIALALLDAGQGVAIVDNLSTGLRGMAPPAAAFAPIDIRDDAALGRFMIETGVEVVVHCAAATVVPESIREPLRYYDNNVGGTLGLLRAMAAAKVRRLLFSSTAAVYRPDGTAPISESGPINPATPYGASKLMTERMIQDAAAAGALEHVILRYFNVAGADPAGRAGPSTPAATNLIKVAAEVAAGRRASLAIFGTDWPTPDGTGVRDFIHVSDLAQAHLLALEHLAHGGANAIFNCGYGRGYSVLQVVQAFEQLVGHPLATTRAGRRPGDLAEVVADASALRTALGWSPRLADLDLIVRHSLDWELRSCGKGP